jgi:hypothetical protein
MAKITVPKTTIPHIPKEGTQTLFIDEVDGLVKKIDDQGNVITLEGGVGPAGPAGRSGQTIGLRLWFDDVQSDMDLPLFGPNLNVSFQDNGSNLDTITRSDSGNWLTDGFMDGRKIIVTNAGNGLNNGIKWIKRVDPAGKILTLTSTANLATESEGAPIQFSNFRRELVRDPVTTTDEVVSVEFVAADGNVSISNFCTEEFIPSLTRIPPGVWNFQGYFFLDAGPSGDGGSNVKFQIRKINSLGFAKEIAETTPTWITKKGMANAQKVIQSLVIPADAPISDPTLYDLELTDRIVIRVITKQNTEISRTMNFIFQGEDYPAYIDTTFNSLSSIQVKQLEDQSFINITAGIIGWGMIVVSNISTGDVEEWIQFIFGDDGNVIVIASSTNAVNTDTNAKFCVFKSGTNIQIKNRLGATKIIKYELKY